MKAIPLTRPQTYAVAIAALALAFGLLVWAVYTFLPVHDNGSPPATWGFSVDWKGCIRTDTLRVLSGQFPYAAGCGHFPPWTYLILAPLALLPAPLGAACMFVITYFVYCGALVRSGAKPWMAVGVLLSPFVFYNANNGNIDWLPVLGFFLPPRIGLFLVLIKPQIGAGIALFWLVEAWRAGRLREVVRVFGPVTAAYLTSLALFGLWPLKLINQTRDPFNASTWPLGLLAGIPLLALGLIRRQKFTAVAATPFLAPYVNFHSYAILLFSFANNEVAFIAVTALSWLILRY